MCEKRRKKIEEDGSRFFNHFPQSLETPEMFAHYNSQIRDVEVYSSLVGDRLTVVERVICERWVFNKPRQEIVPPWFGIIVIGTEVTTFSGDTYDVVLKSVCAAAPPEAQYNITITKR